ncbi:MAG: glycogen-binding domain-containing protein [Gemmatimonadales bacterium]
MKVGPVSFLALLAIGPSTLAAQRQASLGIGTGIVRYAGGSSFSAFTAAPSLQLLSPATYVGIGGSVSLLDSAVWATQGRADLWTTFSQRASGVRPALSISIAASSRSDGLAAGSGMALGEVAWNSVALGAGAITGVIEGEPGVGALRVRGRGWRPLGDSPAQLSLTVEGTRLLGAWYADVVGGVSIERRRLVGSVWLSGRTSERYGSTAAASASVQYFLTPHVVVEASGGNYLRDPFQGLPRAGYATGGIRLYASPRAQLARAAMPARPARLQPLIATHRGGDTVVVRFRMPAAQSVAIAGNWNSWSPAPLRGVGDDVWEAALRLAPGTYYFNLIVDGTDWVVPGGVAVISDGMGGMLAVLNVL